MQIPVIINERPEARSVSVVFAWRAGSRFEHQDEEGVAHALEHLLFKGSSRYSHRDVSVSIAAVGGYQNAYTSKDEIQAHFWIPADHLPQIFEIIADVVLHPSLKIEDVEAEKRILLRESRQLQEDGVQWALFQTLSTMFEGNSLGRLSIGSDEAIDAITPEKLRKFHEETFSSEGCVVAASGQVNNEEIQKLVVDHFQSLPAQGRSFSPVNAPPIVPKLSHLPRASELSGLCVGVRSVAFTDPDYYRLMLCDAALGRGPSSRLFEELRVKRQLAYRVRTNLQNYSDTGFWGLTAGVPPTKVAESIEVMINTLVDLRDDGMNEEELIRARNIVRGALILNYDNPGQLVRLMATTKLHLGEWLTVDHLNEEFRSITLNNVTRPLQQILVPGHFAIAHYGPKTDLDEKKVNDSLSILN
ncbi:MAG: M16 family metallopeptidase [Candidatus Hodarchaeales archaeon]|jgi:predicted Zn-dependent peptidase